MAAARSSKTCTACGAEWVRAHRYVLRTVFSKVLVAKARDHRLLDLLRLLLTISRDQRRLYAHAPSARRQLSSSALLLLPEGESASSGCPSPLPQHPPAARPHPRLCLACEDQELASSSSSARATVRGHRRRRRSAVLSVLAF